MQVQDTPVIKVESLWKRYGLPLKPFLHRMTMRLLGRDTSEREIFGPWSLREIDLEVRQGETIGIIGRNGAGKSTLLKILAGVTPPTYGKVQVNGRVFPMIELNAGLHPELTGRENVYLLGAVMGLDRARITELMPNIEAFCELGVWFDRPVRKYSSGMLSRLGFSVAMNVDCDILLVDEVLAVGDLSFQQKCYNQLARYRGDPTKAVILVSHNVRLIARLCDRAYIFEEGEIIKTGTAEEVVNFYIERTEQIQAQIDNVAQAHIEYAGGISIHTVTMFNGDDEITETIKTGEDIRLRLHYTADEAFEKPIFGIGISSYDLLAIAGVDSWDVGNYVINGEGTIDCSIRELNLLPGTYFVNVTVTSFDGGARIFLGRNLLRFRVIPDEEKYPPLKHTGFVAYLASWDFNEQIPEKTV